MTVLQTNRTSKPKLTEHYSNMLQITNFVAIHPRTLSTTKKFERVIEKDRGLWGFVLARLIKSFSSRA
jgi:hypothetical protein